MAGPIAQRMEGKTIYVVSDLHMGDGTAKDNFAQYRRRFEDFLEQVVEKDCGAALVLAGDTFEFWQSLHGDVVRTYLDLLRRLVHDRSVFIVGNHDIDLLGFVGLPLGPPAESLARNLLLERGGRRIRICHGHEFDRFNDPARSMLVGRIVTLLVGQLEMQVGTRVDGTSTETVLDDAFSAGRPIPSGFWSRIRSLSERVLLKVVFWVAAFYRYAFVRTAAERTKAGKSIDDVRRALDQFRMDNPDDLLVAGHTHKAGWYGEWYVNAGCWQSEQAHYVTIAPEGQVTLYQWPQRGAVNTQLWSTC